MWPLNTGLTVYVFFDLAESGLNDGMLNLFLPRYNVFHMH
jgi:hypothetical protein